MQVSCYHSLVVDMVNISRAQPAEQNAIGGDESAAVTSSSSEAKPSRSPELGGKGAPTRTTASSICEIVGAAAATYGFRSKSSTTGSLPRRAV